MLPRIRREKGDSDEDLAVRNVIDALSPFLGPLETLLGSQQRDSSQVCQAERNHYVDSFSKGSFVTCIRRVGNLSIIQFAAAKQTLPSLWQCTVKVWLTWLDKKGLHCGQNRTD